MRSPRRRAWPSYTDQANQDWGHHEFVFGLAGPCGDWRRPDRLAGLSAERSADRVRKLRSTRGRSVRLLAGASEQSRIRVLALKKAEASDEMIVRMVELDGRPQDVRVPLPGHSPRRAKSMGRSSRWNV